MAKLEKKLRTIEDEFDSNGTGLWDKEYAHYLGLKTWMKKRHFKKQPEDDYPERDMDGSYFHANGAPYQYMTAGRKRGKHIDLGYMDPDAWAGENRTHREVYNSAFGLA